MRNARSRGSMSEVSSVAPRASVRAMMTRGHVQDARGKAAAFRVLMTGGGMSTLPPRWPHFSRRRVGLRSARPRRRPQIMDFMVSKECRGPPKPASASAMMERTSRCPRLFSAPWIWSARMRALFKRRHHGGYAIWRDRGFGPGRCCRKGWRQRATCHPLR